MKVVYFYLVLITSLFGLIQPSLAEAYRLGDGVVPIEQAVSLKLNPAEDAYSGTTKITLDVKADSDSIRFHAVDIDIQSAILITGEHQHSLTVKPEENQIVSASADTKIKAGRYQLEMVFTAKYNRKSVGLYKTLDKNLPYLFTQFEMSDARRAFPLFDEPNYKIPFQLNISAPNDQVVLSNTPVVKKTKQAAWTSYQFEKTPPMPSYLVAIAVGPLELLPVKGQKVPGNIVTPKGKLDQAQYAAKNVPAIINILEDYFGIPYPYAKLDNVALPEFPFGAMENAGLVTYREDTLLLDENRATIIDKTRTVRVIAHELAHQWYGNYVTMKWWNDLWLNEAFATWMAAKVTHQLHPEFEIELKLPQNNVMASDARLSTKPIRKPIKNTADIMDGLGLAYSKGSAVLTMVEQYIGEEAFQKGMRQYMKDFAWGNAEAADLWSSLGAASGKNVQAILQSYTEQSGFPLLTVELKENKLQLKQQRFANAGVKAPAQSWTFPVSIRYGAGIREGRASFLMDKETQTISLDFEPEWIMPDAQGVAYYRWQLSDEKLAGLLSNISKLSNREKLALLNNLDALLSSGVLSAGELMSATRHFLSDAHPLVVSEALGVLRSLKNPFINNSNIKQWQAFIRAAVQPAIERFGLEPKKDEAVHVTSLRPQLILLLAKDGEDKHLIAEANKYAREYFKVDNKVDSSLADAYLEIAAYYGDQKFLDEIKNILLATSDPNRRTQFLIALGQFNAPAVQNQAFDMILDSAITASDVRYLLGTNAEGEERRQRLQAWMFKNYQGLIGKLPPFVVPSMPLLLAGACSSEQLKEIQQFFDKKDVKDEGNARSVLKVSEQVNDCISLQKREQKSVDQYLQQFTNL